MSARDRPLVVGIGNPLRGDDGVGPAVIDELRRRPALDGVDLVTSDRDGPTLLEMWPDRPLVVVIDAMRSAGAEPGTIHRLTGDALRGRSEVGTTTHRMGLLTTVELARTLGRLPDRLVVYGVELADIGAGRPLSAPMTAAVPTVVELVERELTT